MEYPAAAVRSNSGLYDTPAATPTVVRLARQLELLPAVRAVRFTFDDVRPREITAIDDEATIAHSGSDGIDDAPEIIRPLDPNLPAELVAVGARHVSYNVWAISGRSRAP